jgi:hypothetical protein
MLYGIEPSLDEKKKKQKEYEQHNLNEWNIRSNNW